MSGQCTGWVLRFGPHPDHLDRHGKKYGAKARGYRAVLLTIADAANVDGLHSHPGIAAMCTGSLYSRRQVQTIEDELVAEGWVRITEQGGGRGRATVYDVLMDRPERAQSLHPGKGAVSPAKGRSPEPETVQPGADTVQSRLHPNGVATTTNEEPTPPAAPADPAREVVDAFWKWCTDQGRPTPTLPNGGQGNPFMALVKIVRHLLDAGHPVAQVKVALTTTPAYTINALTLQINQRRPPATGARASIAADRERPSGVVSEL
ncbi:MAG: hypothetical protein SHS37scaffold145_23 [Phage 71_18]|nr:MAG: hypothetical protein SHS37scaffold145_23 [Phage 71_18]